MLTHWVMNMDGKVDNLFQPKALDEDGQPVRKLCLCANQLDVQESDFEEVKVPFEILGTTVTDKASGFAGMAVAFIRHVNGCFHVEIQPPGRTSKGSPIKRNDFDLRECEGDMIPNLSESELQKSKKEQPSSCSIPERRLPS